MGAKKKNRPVAIPVEVGQRRRDPDKRASRVVEVVGVERGGLEPRAKVGTVDMNGNGNARRPYVRIKLATIERWEIVEAVLGLAW